MTFQLPPYIRCTHNCERHWLQFNSKKQNMSNWCSPFGQKPIFAETSFERLPSIGIPTEGSFSRSISIARMVKNEQEREKVRERGERERERWTEVRAEVRKSRQKKIRKRRISFCYLPTTEDLQVFCFVFNFRIHHLLKCVLALTCLSLYVFNVSALRINN